MKDAAYIFRRSAVVRSRLLVGVSFALIALAGAGWYGWRWYTTPGDPPAVSLTGAEPVVADAIEAARREVMQNRRSGAAWGHLGQVLRAHGYDAASDVCFAQAEQLDPKEPRWPYLMGFRLSRTAPEAALPLLRTAVARADVADRGNDAPRFRLAEVLLQVGALDEADAELEHLASHDPDNPRLQYNLGILAVARHNDPEAIQHFLRASDNRYTRKKVCAQLAAIYQRLDDARAEEYSRLARIFPPDGSWFDPYIEEYIGMEVGQQSRLLAGERLEAQNRAAEAAQLYRDIALDFPGGRAQIAEGIALSKLGHFEEAEAIFRNILQESPDLVQARYYLGITLYFEGDRLKKASAGDREAALAKFRAAAEQLQRTTELRPDHALAFVYLGLSLRELGRRDKAIEALRMSVHCREELIDTHLHLGEVLAEAGQKEEAIASLERALELSPEHDPRARQALEKVRESNKKPEK